MLKRTKMGGKKPASVVSLDFNSQKWKKVNIRESVKTEESLPHLANLVGLEVLENYDPNLVATVRIIYCK